MNPDQKKIIIGVPETGLSKLKNSQDDETGSFRAAKRRIESQNVNEITVTVTGVTSLPGNMPKRSSRGNITQAGKCSENVNTPFEFCCVQGNPARNLYQENNSTIREELLHEESVDDDFCDVSSMVKVEITEPQDSSVGLKGIPQNEPNLHKADKNVTKSTLPNSPVAFKESIASPSVRPTAAVDLGIRVSRIAPPPLRTNRNPSSAKSEPDPEEALHLVDDKDIESEGETQDHVQVEDFQDWDDYLDPHLVQDLDGAIEEKIRKLEMEEMAKSPKLPPTKRTRAAGDVGGANPPIPQNAANDPVEPSASIIVGKDGTEWRSASKDGPGVGPGVGPLDGREVRPGPVGDAKLRTEPIGCFRIFFSETIMKKIMANTNAKISEVSKKYVKQGEGIQATTIQELEALFGVLYLSAALGSNHLSSDLLFQTEYSGSRFVATMSRRRFDFLIKTLRFDELETRQERKAKSKLAPISEMWDAFVSNCSRNYVASDCVTINHQLVEFEGKCPFRVRVPYVTRHCALKIVVMCDSANKYMLNAIPLLGSDSGPSDGGYVEELVKPIKGSHRIITMGKQLTSVPLVQRLFDDHQLTVVGAVRNDSRALPPCFVDVNYKDREVDSSFFIFSEQVTGVSYKSSPDKLECFLSSVPHVPCGGRKPHEVATYSETKAAVSAFADLCTSMSTNRKTRRWSMCLFYNMLNMAAVNSYVIYLHNFFRSERTRNQKPLSRINFMLKLSEQLSSAWQRHRLEKIPSLSKEVKLQLRQVLGIVKHLPSVNCGGEQHGKRTYCAHCHYSKHRMTSVYCSTCGRPICGEHQKRVCVDC